METGSMLQTSRLSLFRDLLSRVEQEYMILLQEATIENRDKEKDSMSEDGSLLLCDAEIPREKYYTQSSSADAVVNVDDLHTGQHVERVSKLSDSSRTVGDIDSQELKDEPEAASHKQASKQYVERKRVTPNEPLILELLEPESASSPSSPRSQRSPQKREHRGMPLILDLLDLASSSSSPVKAEASPLSSMLGHQQSSPNSRSKSPSNRPSKGSDIDEVRRDRSVSSCSTSAAANTTVFPKWWNPDYEALKQINVFSKSSNKEILALCSRKDQWTRGVFSPVSFPKLHWDFIGYILILYVAWAMPFQVVFGAENFIPHSMRYVDVAITCFFFLDMPWNFNTAFVHNAHVISERRAIVRRYIEGWFLVDLMTCIPFDMMLDEASAFTMQGRLLQILRALKLIRYIRLVQTVSYLQVVDNAYFRIVRKAERWLRYAALIGIMIWNVHVLSCVWSALQPTGWKAHTFSKALRQYFDVFVEVFLAMCIGSRLTSQTVSMQFVEMLIAAERAIIIISIVDFRKGFGSDSQHGGGGRDHVLQYLELRGIPVKTQVMARRLFKDLWERKTINDVLANISNDNLPRELQLRIKAELWEGKLMTIGLNQMISSWNGEFGHSLAISCDELVFPANAVLFNLAENSSAAYYVLAGEFAISSPLLDDEVANVNVGSWLGEDALVNPAGLRGIKAVAACLSSVMAVPSTSFQGSLRSLGLLERFEDWVETSLWRGMCGRCGVIGNHFQDKCPLLMGQYVDRTRLRVGRESHLKKSRTMIDLEADPELKMYLEANDLWDLCPHLTAVGILSLADLKQLKLAHLEAYLSELRPPVALSRREVKLLSSQSVNEFERNLKKGAHVQDATHHFIFLSHFKLEAGTEAALMLSDLEQVISLDESHIANKMSTPIFLDSEDLSNLVDLQNHVRDSMNVVLLLTNGVLSRPWCLVELVTASQHSIPVSLISVDKRGPQFQFPTEAFYADLLAGNTLDDEAQRLLGSCGIDLITVEKTLRELFQHIACPYSPHKPVQIRHAELHKLLTNCEQNFQTSASDSHFQPFQSNPRGSVRRATRSSFRTSPTITPGSSNPRSFSQF